MRPIIVQTPQVMLDTTALGNTFNSVGQSMLQLARAQDQTNRQLQQHIQQGQANIQAHTGALQQLATSTYQRNFDIYLQVYLYTTEAIERASFPGLTAWRWHVSIVGEILRQKLWVDLLDQSRM